MKSLDGDCTLTVHQLLCFHLLDVLKPVSLRTPVAPLTRPSNVFTLTVIIYFAVVFKFSEVHKPCASDVFNILACSRHLFLCSDLCCADWTEFIAPELNWSVGIELSFRRHLAGRHVIECSCKRLVTSLSHYLCEFEKLKRAPQVRSKYSTVWIMRRRLKNPTITYWPQLSKIAEHDDRNTSEGSIGVGKNLLKARVQMGKHCCADHRIFVYYKYLKINRSRTQGIYQIRV